MLSLIGRQYREFPVDRPNDYLRCPRVGSVYVSRLNDQARQIIAGLMQTKVLTIVFMPAFRLNRCSIRCQRELTADYTAFPSVLGQLRGLTFSLLRLSAAPCHAVAVVSSAVIRTSCACRWIASRRTSMRRPHSSQSRLGTACRLRTLQRISIGRWLHLLLHLPQPPLLPSMTRLMMHGLSRASMTWRSEWHGCNDTRAYSVSSSPIATLFSYSTLSRLTSAVASLA